MDNPSACGFVTAFGHRNRSAEVERGESPGSERGVILEPCGMGAIRIGPAGLQSIDVVREHLVRVLAQRRHEYVKRVLYRRIVSIEIGGRLPEPMTEPRPAGKPGEHLIEAGSGRVQSQPSTFEHALEPRPIPDRKNAGLPFHLMADVLDEGIQVHRRVARPAPRETVVEEYVHDDPGVAPAGSGDTCQTGLEGRVAVRESVDGPVERDTGHDPGRGDAFNPALDEIGADVSGKYLAVVG